MIKLEEDLVVEKDLIVEYLTPLEPGIEEELAVKEVIQGDKLLELLEEDPTAEEHETEDIIELLNSAIQDPDLYAMVCALSSQTCHDVRQTKPARSCSRMRYGKFTTCDA